MKTPVTPTNLISVDLENWTTIKFSVNWLLLIGIVIVFCLILWGIKQLIKSKWHYREITIEGIELGSKELKCKITCDAVVEEIAYKLWVELKTRKIAIPVDKNDVIVEVYDSWYKAFISIRELLKEIPGKHLDAASDLIDVTTKVLDEGLRPHLTTWQAKFRDWDAKYTKVKPDDLTKPETWETPQIRQTHYPEYKALWEDLQKTNGIMIAFAEQLADIAFYDQRKRKQKLANNQSEKEKKAEKAVEKEVNEAAEKETEMPEQ